MKKIIHLIDITYLAIIYVTIAIIFSIYLNRLIGPFIKEKESKKSSFMLICEIYLNFAIIAIVAYLIRAFVEHIPFPLDDVYDHDHKGVHELNGGIVFGFVIFYYQINLCEKINYLFNERIFKNSSDKLNVNPTVASGIN